MSKFHFQKKAQTFKSNTAQALTQMANNAVFEFRNVSFRQHSFDGQPWAPLKDGDHPPLEDTLTLRKSINILHKDEHRAIVGSTLDYAKFQNFGTGTIPARKFIGNTHVLAEKNIMVLRTLMRKKL